MFAESDAVKATATISGEEQASDRLGRQQDMDHINCLYFQWLTANGDLAGCYHKPPDRKYSGTRLNGILSKLLAYRRS